MSSKRSHGASRTVKDEQNDGGPSVKQEKDVLPRKIVRGAVQNWLAPLPAAAGCDAAACDVATRDVATGVVTAGVAAISTTKASSRGKRLLSPSKRTIASSMKARRKLAERRRSGDGYSNEWDDESSGEDDGNSKDYNLLGRLHVSASKHGRLRLSAMPATESENHEDDYGSDESEIAVASRSIVNEAPCLSPGVPSNRRLKAATTSATCSAVAPAAATSKRKSRASQKSDVLPVTKVSTATGMSDSSAASRPSMLSPSSSSSRVVPTLAAASGSAPRTRFVHLPLVVWPSDLAAAALAATQIASQSVEPSPVPLSVVLRLTADECSKLSTSGLPIAAAAAALEVPALVVEASDSYPLSSSCREPADAATGLSFDELFRRLRNGLQNLDCSAKPSADARDTVQRREAPVTVAAPNENDIGDKRSLRSKAKSNLPAAAERRVLSEGSATAAGLPLSVNAARGGHNGGETVIGSSSSASRTAADGLYGRSPAGSVAATAKLSEAVSAQIQVRGRAQSSNPTRFACSVCKKFFNKDGLSKHLRSVHSGYKPHRCPHCDYASPWKGNLNTHIAGVHFNARSHQCSHCTYRCKTHCAMLCHMRQMHKWMYKPKLRRLECEECHEKFVEKIHLQQHLQLHSGEKPSICTVHVKKCTRQAKPDDHIEVAAGSVLPVMPASTMLLPSTSASLSLTSADGQHTRGNFRGRKRGGQRRVAADLDGAGNVAASFSV